MRYSARFWCRLTPAISNRRLRDCAAIHLAHMKTHCKACKRRSMHRSFRHAKTTGFTVLMAFTISVGWVHPGLAQAQGGTNLTESRTAEVTSGAELEAEQSVALSPDKIIDFLSQEPGLLLVVKKMLVRKAYEQGRIL